MLFDLREALRTVRRHVRFSALVCGILALGIGATALAYSIDAVAFVNTWIQHPERLGWIFGIDARHANDRAALSLPDFVDFRERTQAFESIGARAATTLTVTGRGQATRLAAYQVTTNLLDIWGLPVTRGRGFREGEDQPGGTRVVVISNRLWQTTLAGDPSAIGASLTLDGAPYTIVGVLDPRLDKVFASADLWVPFDLGAARNAQRDARSLPVVVGVLKPGVSVAQAHDEIHAFAAQLAAEHPDTNRGWDARVVDTHTGRTGPQTYYNLALDSIAAALVMLNACVNVVLLLIARGIARQKEFSVRLAVGAGWLRIVRQQVFEGMLIAFPATLIGFGLTLGAIRLMLMSADPYYKRILIDWQLFGVAACASLLTPLVFGLVPAIQLLRGRVPLTTSGSTEAQSGRKGHRSQRLLATTQIAAALILLIVSAIVLRSVLTSMSTDVGFDTRQVATVGLTLPTWKYPSGKRLSDVFASFVDRASRIPGVSGAAVSTVNPALSSGPTVAARLESESPSKEGENSAQLAIVSPDLFDTLGVRVVSGRDFTSQDRADTTLTALVNRQFALRYDNPQQLLGRHLSIRGETRLREIVGVVGNIRNLTGADVPPFVYLPHTQESARTMFLVARVAEGSTLEPMRRALAEVDADVAPYQLRTFAEWIWVRQSGDLAMFAEFATLAGISAALAALGLFGVFSCFVGQRRRDFALRLALGASPRHVTRMILTDGLLTVFPGIVAGVVGGALLSRFAIGVVYGITANPYDRSVYAGSILLLLISAMAALTGPAFRARSVQVADVLRTS